MLATASRTDYAKLKKDLLFHERRMQLLLSSRVAEDLQHNLREKNESRTSCAVDCRDAMHRFESGATEVKLSGRWNEVRISSLFGLEVPLQSVVGSDKFEAPESTMNEFRDLLEQVHRLSQKIPEFRQTAADPSNKGAEEAKEAIQQFAQGMHHTLDPKGY